VNRRRMNLAETRLPPNIQAEITAPATGIETIDPTDAVIENPGAKTARIVKVIAIAPVDSVSRMKLTAPPRRSCDLGLVVTLSPHRRAAAVGRIVAAMRLQSVAGLNFALP
jgi:hypothetical protein